MQMSEKGGETYSTSTSGDNLRSVPETSNKRLELGTGEGDLLGLKKSSKDSVALLLNRSVGASDELGLRGRSMGEESSSGRRREERDDDDEQVEHRVRCGRRGSRSRSRSGSGRVESLSEMSDDLLVGGGDVGPGGDGQVRGDDLSDHTSLLSGNLGEDVKQNGEEVLGHAAEELEVGLSVSLVDTERSEELCGRSGRSREGDRGLHKGLERPEKGRSKRGLGVENLGDEGSELIGESL